MMDPPRPIKARFPPWPQGRSPAAPRPPTPHPPAGLTQGNTGFGAACPGGLRGSRPQGGLGPASPPVPEGLGKPFLPRSRSWEGESAESDRVCSTHHGTGLAGAGCSLGIVTAGSWSQGDGTGSRGKGRIRGQGLWVAGSVTLVKRRHLLGCWNRWGPAHQSRLACAGQ